MSEKLLAKLRNYKRQIKALDRAHRLTLFQLEELQRLHAAKCRHCTCHDVVPNKYPVPEYLKYQQMELFDARPEQSPVTKNHDTHG